MDRFCKMIMFPVIHASQPEIASGGDIIFFGANDKMKRPNMVFVMKHKLLHCVGIKGLHRFICVNGDDPVILGTAGSIVFGGGKVVDPFKMVDRGEILSGNLHTSVRRTGIN